MGNIANKPRNYGIDLLRMFAMYLIALLHVLGQGGVIGATTKDAISYNVAWFLEIGAYCCVNCYALISGYVGLNSKFKYTNIVMLWLRVLFYTVGITAIFRFVMPGALVNSDKTDNMLFLISEKWDNALFPVSTKQYWYFTAYFLCYFFTPILNKAVHTLEQKQLKKSIAALVLIISVPALFTGNDVFGAASGYSALWLIVLYLVGAYMKKYNSLNHIGKIEAIAGYIASITVTWVVKYAIGEFFPQFRRANLLISYTSPTIIASGIFLFIFFKNINPPKFCCKLIGFLSPLAFSVYLIHVHPLVWEHVMKGLFKPLAKLPTPLMALSVIGAALGLYLACSLIDIIRHYLFKLLRLQKLVYAVETKITDKFSKKETVDETSLTEETKNSEESEIVNKTEISELTSNNEITDKTQISEEETIKI